MFIFQKIRGLLHSTPTRLIAGYYFLFTVGFAILLWLPFSLQEEHLFPFLTLSLYQRAD